MNRLAGDRRRPYRGDQRRAQLLEALDGLLQHTALDDINVADVATAAGVTRSAFYFYFESKAAAVAALSAQLFDDSAAAAEHLLKGEGPPRPRIEAQTRDLMAGFNRSKYLYRAMLDARESDSALRQAWDEARQSFVEPLATWIDAERAAGRASNGPDSRAVATLLLELNEQSIERVSRGDTLALEDRVDVIVTLWLRAIYGHDNKE